MSALVAGLRVGARRLVAGCELPVPLDLTSRDGQPFVAILGLHISAPFVGCLCLAPAKLWLVARYSCDL